MKPLLLDLPNAALSYWKIDAEGRVRWLSRDEGAARGFTKQKLSKLHPDVEGKPAGYQPVYGRGFIVMCSRRRILTCDIATSLRAGAWSFGAGPEHEPAGRETVMHLRAVAERIGAPAGSVDDVAAAIARYWWRIDENAKLVWRTAPHETRPAGSVAEGVNLLGGRVAVTTSGLGFLTDDIRALLYAGRWPWHGVELVKREPFDLPAATAPALSFPDGEPDFYAKIAAFKARSRDIEWD